MFTEEELQREGLNDFRVFLIEVWAFLLLPRPTPVQLNIAQWLQHGPKRFILCAFRGVGKSWVTAAFVCWLLLLDPQRKIMVVSANEKTATDITKFIKQLIHGMPVLQHLAPRSGQLDRTDSFDVGPARPSKDPSVKSVGITGQLTGSRADIIVADDIEVPKNSYTHVLRERLAELVKEFDSILKPEPASRVLYLGTPQNEQSLYPKLEKRGYEMRIWPAEIPSKPSSYKGRLAPMVQRMIDSGLAAGTPVDTRFDRETLAANKLSYGRAGYALQFMLDTTPNDVDTHPLKLRDLIIHACDIMRAPVEIAWGGSPDLVVKDLTPGGFDGDVYHHAAWKSDEMAKYGQTVMTIDPSGRGKDETAYAVVKYMHGTLYLMDVGGYLDGFAEDTLKGLAGKALRWGVNDIAIETNYGGGMFNKLLQPWLIRVFGEANDGKLGAAGKIDEEWNGWSSTSKELRICDTMEPVLANHRLVVDRKVIESDLVQLDEDPQYSFVYQLTRMERQKDALRHEDRLEAVSMAVAYFTEKMNRDSKRALSKHKDNLLDQELKTFRKHVFGVKTKPQPMGLTPKRGTWKRMGR